MEKAEDWAQTDDVERALIVLASFNVWTLEEAAHLYAGLLPPGYKEQQDMLVKRMMAEKALRELESAIKRVEGRVSLMFCGTGGLNVEIQAVDEKGRFKAADLVEFMCHMFSKRSMQTLLSYRKRGLDWVFHGITLKSTAHFQKTMNAFLSAKSIRSGLLVISNTLMRQN